jgi:K+-sensing histidine kinase KdpD
LKTNSKRCKKNVWLDKAMVFNVAENLITNAVRFAKTKIQISLKLDKETLILSVQDDGSGFPQAILRKGAEPFLRGDEGNDHSPHFGMGLYVCRLLCEKHNGSLQLQNTQDGALAKARFKVSKT